MSQTFAQLGQLLLGAIPTIIIFGLLHLYLRAVLYKPLRQTLAARSARIEGRLELARQHTEAAEAKLRQYEESVRQARAEGYRGIEKRRKEAGQVAQENLAQARKQNVATLAHALQQLAGESTRAQNNLRESSETMAAQIAGQVLGTRQGANAV